MLINYGFLRRIFYMRNTMSGKEYIKLNVFWLIISMIWYKNLLFKNLHNYSYFDSHMMLWTSMIIFSIIALILTYGKSQNGFSIASNLLIPLEIYTAIAYYSFFPVLITVVTVVSSIIILLYSVPFFTSHINSKKNRYKIIRNRMKTWFCGSKIILACSLFALLLPLAAKSMFNVPLLSSNIKASNNADQIVYSMENNIDELKKLRNDIWEKLSVRERLDILQIVANIEQERLGISAELDVSSKNLSEYTLGQYDYFTDKIYIDLETIKNSSSEEIMNTICHEAYHVYQFKMADVYEKLDEKDRNLKLFEDAKNYAANRINYHRSGKEYLDQPLEVDARDYAIAETAEYFVKIADSNGI